MMLRVGLVLAALLAIAVVLGGVFADGQPAATHSDPPPVPPATAAATQPLPQLVGFTINLHQPGDIQPALDAVDHLADLGFNGLQLTVPVFQTNGSDASPRRMEQPGYSATDEQILAVLTRAEEHGMHTNLLWQINFTHPRGNEWRGKIQPPAWDPWWQAYRELLIHHAKLAATANADAFTVGCELLSTHKPEFKHQWHATIALARKHFTGRLVYSSTWDSFHSYPAWETLDLIGISGWWNLTRQAADADNPTDAELAARWATIRHELEGFAAAFSKPLIITEVGYPTIPWALKDPWNYVPDRDTKPDPHAQARGYASFLDAWSDVFAPPGLARRSEAFAAVFFYEWSPYADSGAPGDFGYSPRNKPAEPLLEAWLHRDRPTPTTATAPANATASPPASSSTSHR